MKPIEHYFTTYYFKYNVIYHILLKIQCYEGIVINTTECMLCQFAKPSKWVENYTYHCSTQVQLGSMHSAPADVGEE